MAPLILHDLNCTDLPGAVFEANRLGQVSDFACDYSFSRRDERPVGYLVDVELATFCGLIWRQQNSNIEHVGHKGELKFSSKIYIMPSVIQAPNFAIALLTMGWPLDL